MKKTPVLCSTMLFLAILILAAIVAACASPLGALDAQSVKQPASQSDTVKFTLRTGMEGGMMSFSGVGGSIDGQVNPTLKVQPGQKVEIILENGDDMTHNISIPDYQVTSADIQEKGKTTQISFVADKAGTFPYFCTLPGHRQAGMEGKLVVGDAAVAAAPVFTAASIARDPTDLPAPVGGRAPTLVRVDLESQEVEGQLADGVTYTYWTFNGKVPGPFIRVRQGDQVEVHLKNSASSTMAHSVDFHAVTGPGGGAAFTVTTPGQETSFKFTALNPGLFVYHCATPSVATHIANGMYGMILVEPPEGLPQVDREFYVMQGEMYTKGAYGQSGHQEFDPQKLLNETPEYYVLNGAVGALTAQHPLTANTGETIRIYFGVGGPNKTSSFHMIGEIFDRVYNLGSLTSAPLTDVQTVMVPTGGAVAVEIKLQVPGRYIMVDHSLSRMERGLAGYLMVTGPDAPEIILGTPMPGSGH